MRACVWLVRACVFASVFARFPAAWAQTGEDEPPEDFGPVCLVGLHFEGLESTQRRVVVRELRYAGVQPGAQVGRAEVEEGAQRLRNLGIFRTVRYALAPVHPDTAPATRPDCAGAPPRHLTVEVEEKWTMLPILNFRQGGGTYRLVLGAYDTNFLGRYLNVGAQYERLGDANSFFVWAGQPRLFDRRLRAEIGVGQRNEVFHYYRPDDSLGWSFLLRRWLVETYLEREWFWWARMGLVLRYQDDDFARDRMSGLPLQQVRAMRRPEASRALIAGAKLKFGRLNRDSFLVDGAALDLTLLHANEHVGSSYSFGSVSGSARFFRTLPFRSTLGLALDGGWSETTAQGIDALHRKFYLGGLTTLRGFSVHRFRGDHFWSTTAELRVPSLANDWAVVQHIFFVDAGGVADDLSELGRLSGASAGLGLRLIVPKVQDFIMRIDYAFPLYRNAPNPVSLGGGQFF